MLYYGVPKVDRQKHAGSSHSGEPARSCRKQQGRISRSIPICCTPRITGLFSVANIALACKSHHSGLQGFTALEFSQLDMKSNNLGAWTSPVFPLRKVVEVRAHTTRYNRPGEGSNQFILECGHVAWSKYSQGTPKRKRCRQCYLATHE